MGGKLIVFEGVEGAGKTTQIEQTYQWLQDTCSQEVVVTREPGGTEFGLGIRQLLLQQEYSPSHRTELLLYAADRAQHVEELIQPWLSKGMMVLCDRYTDSTIAYQGYGRGIDLDLIAQLNQIATGGQISDLTIWLDVDVEQGLARAKKRGTTDRIEQAEISFHRRVKEGFTALAKEFPQRIVRVDANLSAIQVQEQIRLILTKKLDL